MLAPANESGTRQVLPAVRDETTDTERSSRTVGESKGCNRDEMLEEFAAPPVKTDGAETRGDADGA